jgi:uncharacterized phage protein gp47/JayE
MSNALARMKARHTAYPAEEGSFLHDAFAPVAAEVDLLTDEVLPAAMDAIMVDSSTGSDLDRVALAYGVYRKDAVAATGEVVFQGIAGTEIARYVPVSTAGGRIFLTDAGSIISSSGYVTVPIIAVQPGAEGNVAAGSIVMIPIALAGVESVSNSSATQGGSDEEDDASFRQRLLMRIQLPSASGCEADYVRWARDVPGVDGARCIGLWNGPGTVKVIIAGNNMQPADLETITRCSVFIESVRPIGAEVTVVSAQALAVDIAATVTLASGYSLSLVEDAFTETVRTYLSEQAFAATYLSYARIGSLLLKVEGVEDYSLLTLNGTAGNIALSDEAVPVLGTVTLS